MYERNEELDSNYHHCSPTNCISVNNLIMIYENLIYSSYKRSKIVKP